MWCYSDEKLLVLLPSPGRVYGGGTQGRNPTVCDLDLVFPWIYPPLDRDEWVTGAPSAPCESSPKGVWVPEVRGLQDYGLPSPLNGSHSPSPTWVSGRAARLGRGWVLVRESGVVEQESGCWCGGRTVLMRVLGGCRGRWTQNHGRGRFRRGGRGGYGEGTGRG